MLGFSAGLGGKPHPPSPGFFQGRKLGSSPGNLPIEQRLTTSTRRVIISRRARTVPLVKDAHSPGGVPNIVPLQEELRMRAPESEGPLPAPRPRALPVASRDKTSSALLRACGSCSLPAQQPPSQTCPPPRLGTIILFWGRGARGRGRPGHCRMFSNIPGHYPLHNCGPSPPHIVTTKNISRYGPMFPCGQCLPLFRTTV